MAGAILSALNCAAIPTHLIEDELFGHARGAFTDARSPKAGLFKEAHGGTLFLDEIGDMDRQSEWLNHSRRRRGSVAAYHTAPPRAHLGGVFAEC